MSPNLRVRYPVPPPSVRPATPVLPTIPNGTARPKAWRRVVDVRGAATRLHPHGPGGGVDPHALHHRQIDDEAVVAAAEPGTVVTAAADGEQQALLAGEVHGGDDVGRVDGARDQARALVDHAVVERTNGVVVRVGLADEPAAKSLLECGDSLVVHETSEREEGQARELSIVGTSVERGKAALTPGVGNLDYG